MHTPLVLFRKGTATVVPMSFFLSHPRKDTYSVPHHPHPDGRENEKVPSLMCTKYCKVDEEFRERTREATDVR